MIKKKKAFLTLAREMVAIYGSKAIKPIKTMVVPETEAHPPGPIQNRQLTIGETYAGRKNVPLLRLQGWWLERAGFPAGTRVVVQVQERRILIRG